MKISGYFRIKDGFGMALDDGNGNNVYFMPADNELNWHVFDGYTGGDEIPVEESKIPKEVRLAMLTAKIVLSH